jgi:hypothetical protein
LTWYCSLTSASFNFLISNLCISNFCATRLITDSLSLSSEASYLCYLPEILSYIWSSDTYCWILYLNIIIPKPKNIFLYSIICSRWEDNIKTDLWEIGFGDVDWIHWAQDRDRWRALVNTVMNVRVP